MWLRSLEKYNYEFPKKLIAQKPATPRDSARLLVYDRKSKKIYIDRFINLAEYLPRNSVLVFNETKVIPARLHLTKETGGRAEVLYVGLAGDKLKVIADRKLSVGSKVRLNHEKAFQVARRLKNFYLLNPLFRIGAIDSFFRRYGQTPIPPYIKHSSLSERKLRTEYQTVFAKKAGSDAINELPEGFMVVENQRTGLPTLKKK